MNPHIPEEIELMAAFLGESANIDSSYVEKPVGLNTNTNTIKQSINQYVQQQRQGIQPPPIRPEEYQQYLPPSTPQPQFSTIPQYQSPKTDDGQLEFNLEPSKMDEIIILLKEISVKLTKQNSMLEKINANASKKEGVPTPIVKLGASK